jgi:hypothetical protein
MTDKGKGKGRGKAFPLQAYMIRAQNVKENLLLSKPLRQIGKVRLELNTSVTSTLHGGLDEKRKTSSRYRDWNTGSSSDYAIAAPMHTHKEQGN